MIEEFNFQQRVVHQLRDPFAIYNTFYDVGAGGHDAADSAGQGAAGGPGGDSNGDTGGHDAMGNPTGTTQATANTEGYGNNSNDPNNTGEGSVDGIDDNGRQASSIGPATEETISLDQTIEQGTKGITHADGTTTYGFDTFNGVTTEETFLGLFSIDTHHHLNGQSFSTADEMAADVLDVFGIDVTAKNIDATKSIAQVAIAAIFHAPTISLAISTVNAINEVGYAAGTIGKQTHNEISLGITIASIAVTGIAGIKGISAGINALDHGYTALGTLSIGLSAYGMYSAVNKLSNTLASMGYSNTTTNTAADFAETYNGEDSAAAFINGYADHIKNNTNTSNFYLLNDNITHSSDVFKYMAGGKYYDIKMAGSKFWHPGNDSMEVNPEQQNILLGKEVAASVLQTDMIEHNNNMLPLHTSKDKGNRSYERVVKSIYDQLLYSISMPKYL